MNSQKNARRRTTKVHSPGELFRLVDLRADTSSCSITSLLDALAPDGRVLWVQLLPSDSGAEPPGQSLLHRRLISVGRVSREDQQWHQEDPFHAFASVRGEGWCSVHLRIDQPVDWGEFHFNLGVARSFYRWIILCADQLPQEIAAPLRTLWPLEVLLADQHLSRREIEKKHPRKEERLLLTALSAHSDQSRSSRRSGSWSGPHAFCSSDPSELARAVVQWNDERFLRRHPAHWVIRWSRRLLWPAVVVALIAAMVTPLTLRPERRLPAVGEEQEFSRFEVSVGDPYDARRAARWALYRFNRRFPSEVEIRSYLCETLKRADIELQPDLSWKILSKKGKQGEKKVAPPSSKTRLEFQFPSQKLSALTERERQAYRFYTDLFLDSLAYPTDYWWMGSEKKHRRHDAIDIGAVPGTTVLSPISGVVFTGEGYLGGVFIGVRDSVRVVLLAHCDKRLFLQGDTVRAGDAFATVGMTGRTSGPHIHLMTGLIDPTGKSVAGGVRLQWKDPVEWFHRQIAR